MTVLVPHWRQAESVFDEDWNVVDPYETTLGEKMMLVAVAESAIPGGKKEQMVIPVSQDREMATAVGERETMLLEDAVAWNAHAVALQFDRQASAQNQVVPPSLSLPLSGGQELDYEKTLVNSLQKSTNIRVPP
jgi:hypothetical protein